MPANHAGDCAIGQQGGRLPDRHGSRLQGGSALQLQVSSRRQCPGGIGEAQGRRPQASFRRCSQGACGTEMNRGRYVAAVLAGTALLACSIASAQPRAEPEINFKAIEPITEPAQVAAWLQRLTGRYRYDGMIQMAEVCAEVPADSPPPPPSDLCQGIKGKSDCVAIGT